MRCDVCETEFDQRGPAVFWSEFRLPANWLPAYAEDSQDDVLTLDICSVECLVALGKVLTNEPEKTEPDNDDEDIPDPLEMPHVTVR
jgi:hypothetical protein